MTSSTQEVTKGRLCFARARASQLSREQVELVDFSKLFVL